MIRRIVIARTVGWEASHSQRESVILLPLERGVVIRLTLAIPIGEAVSDVGAMVRQRALSNESGGFNRD